jgi:hypothetical protein
MSVSSPIFRPNHRGSSGQEGEGIERAHALDEERVWVKYKPMVDEVRFPEMTEIELGNHRAQSVLFDDAFA